jgi:PE family
MSFVIAVPEMMASAASDVAGIGSMIGEANAAAAAPTTGVLAAAGDEVSAAIASLFSSHAQEFQAVSDQAAAGPAVAAATPSAPPAGTVVTAAAPG